MITVAVIEVNVDIEGLPKVELGSIEFEGDPWRKVVWDDWP